MSAPSSPPTLQHACISRKFLKIGFRCWCGMFARKFIADKRDTARQLKTEAQEEFRSIVYGYMSRVRRGDAKLYFPDRIVQLHRVDPTPAELELLRAISKP